VIRIPHLVCCLALLSAPICECREGTSRAETRNARADSAQTTRQRQLTAEAQAELQGYIRAGELPDLHWPNFEPHRREVEEFYGTGNNVLPWVRDRAPSPQSLAMIHLLENADNKGLNPEDYDGGLWEGRLAALEQSKPPLEADLVRFDLAVTVSVMRYVSDLYSGRVNPRQFDFEFEIGKKEKLDLSEFLRQRLIGAEDVGAVIRSAEPPFPAYRRTIDALSVYRDLARRDDGELLPVPRKTVKPGDTYSGVPRLVRLLELLGDLPSNQKPAPEQVYEGSLVDAVKHFQERHGLNPTGQIGSETLRELNTPLSRRVEQLQLTLERWRWAPREFEHPPITVNIPEFRLRVDNEQYQWVLSMKVVVGKSYRHQTPVFSSELKSVIFRPYWNVPIDIQRDELLPEIEKDPSYLARHSYEIVDRNGRVVSDGLLTAEMQKQLYSGRLQIRQKPGPNNSLGLIKFDLPNAHDVYLHGTPARTLFSQSRRDFSHGCIRVEDPVTLAAWVLRDKPGWDADHIRAAMSGDETTRVMLDKPIPVLIVYGTAVVMEDGEVRFFEDIYGHDAALERVLAKGYGYLR